MERGDNILIRLSEWMNAENGIIDEKNYCWKQWYNKTKNHAQYWNAVLDGIKMQKFGLKDSKFLLKGKVLE